MADLPERTTVVVTSDSDYEQTLQNKFGIKLDNKSTIEVTHSPTEGLNIAKELAKENDQKKVCIARGGSSIYKALLPETNELVLTLIDKYIKVSEDDNVTRFPPYEGEFIEKKKEAEHGKHEPAFAFVTLTRS